MLPSGLPKYKNKLQEYAQRSALQIPSYTTVNEGFVHAPKFRSTVLIGHQTYCSPNTFSTRKMAEQDVAKLALGTITKNMNQHNTLCSPLNHQASLSWKSILVEFAVKTNKVLPQYTTATHSGAVVFVSKVVFGDKTYTGELAKSKKDAEQCVAKRAITSILESGSRNIVLRIIQSKGKHNMENTPSVERKRKFEDTKCSNLNREEDENV